MYSDRQARANSVDPDKNAESRQGLKCLPLIQQLLDTTLGSKLYFFKFQNKNGKELRCPNTLGKCGNIYQKYRRKSGLSSEMVNLQEIISFN